LKDNLKVSFPQASEIAAKQIANGTVVEGQMGIVQGYVAYAFFIHDNNILLLSFKTGY